MVQDADGNAEAAPKRQPWKLAGAIGTALLVAMATAIGSGLGSKALDLFRSDPQPVSYSEFEQVLECGSELFLAEPEATRLTSGATVTPASPPPPGAEIGLADWQALQAEHGAVVADKSVVEVSIQGESARTITLTGIEFFAERKPRPDGVTLSNACGGPITGRYVVADLDQEPVAVVGTARDPDALVTLAALGETEGGPNPYEPIRFPWTVSVTDPLLLKIIATTRRCYCRWRAEIPWRSGGASGEIAIDNRGSGYTVAGDEGAPAFVRSSTSRSGWTLLDPAFG